MRWPWLASVAQPRVTLKHIVIDMWEFRRVLCHELCVAYDASMIEPNGASGMATWQQAGTSSDDVGLWYLITSNCAKMALAG